MSQKKKSKKTFFKPIHIEAFLFLVGYFIFSILIFAGLVSHPDSYISTFGPFLFGLISTFGFLYVFSHKDFFEFSREIERAEKGKEERYLNKYLKYGKFVACLLIGQFGGPILLALTIRIMFPASGYKYWIALACVSVNTVIAVAVAKGLLTFVI